MAVVQRKDGQWQGRRTVPQVTEQERFRRCAARGETSRCAAVGSGKSERTPARVSRAGTIYAVRVGKVLAFCPLFGYNNTEYGIMC